MTDLLLPPQAIEAEQSVLGCLLLDNAAWDRIADVVQESDFYRSNHRLIFRHIAQAIEDNKPADTLTICEALGDQLEDVGGMGYVASLPNSTPSAANIRRYAELVRERSLRRQLIAVCTEATEAAYASRGDDTPALLGTLETKLYALHQRDSRGARPISDILTEVVEAIDERCARDDPSEITGLATGFVDLDKLTAGLQPGDLIIVAARPSMGKTALAMNMVEHVTIALQKSAGVFSLEMSDRQLAQRMLGSVGRVNQHALRAGRLNDDDWSRMTRAVGELNVDRIFIEETYDLSPSTIRAKARRMKRERPDLSLIVVDYLQLMDGDAERRVDQIAEISRGLKRLAKELNLPVVALSQLNRSLEQRPNKRPQMSDLRDSGALEQDADVILFLYRDEVYDPESPAKGTAELIIGKQRNGPIDTVRLTFIPQFTRFENFSGEIPYAAPRPRSRPFQVRERADIDR